MERHVGIWYKDCDVQNKDVAELIIDGNHIEFYSRFHGLLYPCTFIGSDGQYSYKVFANGDFYPRLSESFEYTSSHNVLYALKQKCPFSEKVDICGINEFSFSFPELINWLGLKTVSYELTDMKDIAAHEKHLKPIIINSDTPYIEIYFESKTLDNRFTQDIRTSITIKKEPRIRVVYDEPKEIQTILNDIQCLMQFFGLLIGSVSVVENICLSIDGQVSKSWLFINYDYSYNTKVIDVIDRMRTYLYVIKNNFSIYYLNWRNFYYDDTYALLRKIYFSVNSRDDIFVEEMFVQYMRILDGYYTRILGDDKYLNKAINDTAKEIQKLIFDEGGKPKFEDSIRTVGSDWKYDSKNRNNIAKWIANGYANRKSLSDKLIELDNKYLSIIGKNSVRIEKNSQNHKKIEGKSDKELTKLFFKELGNTRNYYSHYKLDRSGILDINQIIDSINVLKATIISIFLSHMEIENEMIRKIMALDCELFLQTKCLRKKTDQFFKHPDEIIETEKSN